MLPLPAPGPREPGMPGIIGMLVPVPPPVPPPGADGSTGAVNFGCPPLPYGLLPPGGEPTGGIFPDPPPEPPELDGGVGTFGGAYGCTFGTGPTGGTWYGSTGGVGVATGGLPPEELGGAPTGGGWKLGPNRFPGFDGSPLPGGPDTCGGVTLGVRRFMLPRGGAGVVTEGGAYLPPGAGSSG
ncbi:hypothetical protein Athai_31390 [Actinocatenispora thailandica]|uniref:Uncharacterized protein n=1 Tax=Actinocatenispora thailandica TaxID=227318 RepID=A0A7R7DQ12_9ACTN|nr:hypothetical protein Athai_31390 [Actinocatenispora thailandica]